jgi:hypothetical protein
MSLARAIAHLRAGEWSAAHAIVQDDESMLGCWAHGIVHLMEGDTSNARYWYRRAPRSLPDATDRQSVESEIEALAAALLASS